jgi:EAL domain-containing protein (putative c-di-GMP-specific phosphodiesterase class I)
MVIANLHTLGVHISVDDFGSGFTSLAYLVSLAVDELKLDRTFVTPLTTGESERARPLLRATIELGHSMGMRVVAEGVEDTTTLELLRRFGCDRVQGYLIGHPVPAEQLTLRTHGRLSISSASR